MAWWVRTALIVSALVLPFAKSARAQSLDRAFLSKSDAVPAYEPPSVSMLLDEGSLKDVGSSAYEGASGGDASSEFSDEMTQAETKSQEPDLPDEPKPANRTTAHEAGTQCNKPPCLGQRMNWYKRFVNGPQVKPLTPEEKGWLALRNFLDPFNAITILGGSAIAIGSDSHSAYGPGMPGFGRDVGVSYAEDLTGEFFNTFLICSIAHQDPHYHRMPHASYVRRSLHAVSQVVWTQGDNEHGMLNYANLVGFGIDDEIANLYVPGRETNARASAERYATGLASAPISNFITEFLPDVANHIHIQVVIVQRIINQVANKEAAGQ